MHRKRLSRQIHALIRKRLEAAQRVLHGSLVAEAQADVELRQHRVNDSGERCNGIID